jgi:predicted secreted protein
MNSRMALLFCMAGVLALAAGCGNLPPLDVLVLGPADDGTTVQVHNIDRLIIVLPANGTTGFTWQVATGDTSIVELVETKTLVFPTGPGVVVGQGGAEALTFLVVGTEGSTNLTLENRKAGEPPADTFSITVTVVK